MANPQGGARNREQWFLLGLQVNIHSALSLCQEQVTKFFEPANSLL